MKMKVLVVSIFLFIVSVHATRSLDGRHGRELLLAETTPPSKSGFVNTFYEPFDGASGSLPSSPNWLIDLGTSYPGMAAGWGNSESETYTSNASNLAITRDQTLAITPQVTKGAWTSGRIETSRSDFACNASGKLFVEARIKLGVAQESQMQGIWPAFWALGSAFRGNYKNWPMIGEWDFFETVNGLPKMYTTIHCGVAPGGPCNEYNGIGNSVDFSQGEWHVVGFQVDRSMTGSGGSGTWKDENLSWYLDGNVVFSVTGSRVNDEAAWEQLAHTEHFLLLNVAVGGSFPNALYGGSTPTSATIGGSSVGMEIDYVGVWNSV